MQYVYLLECTDQTHYVGCTHDLKRRLTQHEQGEVHYTKSRLPIRLVTYLGFSEKHKAFAFEKYLKSGSGRAFFKKRLV